MRVYVQVPVSGRDFEEALKECDERCTDIAAKGHEAVNPLRVLDIPRDTASREAIGQCVALLMTCDAIYAHPNVTDPSEKEKISAGCLAEACAALAYGLKFIWDNKHDDGEVMNTTEKDPQNAKQLIATTTLYKVCDTALILRDRPGEHFGSTIWGNPARIAGMIARKMEEGNWAVIFELANSMKKTKDTVWN